MRIGPAHVDQDQDPRREDDQHAEDDAKAEPRHQDRAEQRFVVGDQQDKADVDDRYYRRQQQREAPPGGGDARQMSVRVTHARQS